MPVLATSALALVVVGRHGRVVVARVELGHHVHEGHIEEDAGRGAEDPGRPVLDVAQQQADDHAHEGQERAETVWKNTRFT